MSYEINQGVEMPPVYRGRPQSPERAAMVAMGIGDSFLIEDEKKAHFARCLSNKLAPKAFSVRKIPGEGWRVWRLA